MPAQWYGGPGVTAFRAMSVATQLNSAGANLDAATGFGTPNVAEAEHKLMFGTMTITDDHRFHTPEEERNSLSRVHRATPVAKNGRVRFDGSVVFERIPWLFSMAAGHALTEAEAAGSNALGNARVASSGGVHASDGPDVIQYTIAPGTVSRWLWRPAMNQRTVPEFFTVHYGDNNRIYRLSDALARSVALRGDMEAAVTHSTEMFSKAPVGFGGGTSPHTWPTQAAVHDAVSQITDIYLSDIGSDHAIELASFINGAAATLEGLTLDGKYFGASTAVNNIPLQKGLISNYSVTLNTGFDMTRYSSGELDFTTYSQMFRSVDFDLTIRHSDAGRNELAKYRADSNRGRFIRLVTQGPEFLIPTAAGAVAGIMGRHGTIVGNIDPGEGDRARQWYAINASILYNEPPDLFTDYKGDDVFTLRGSSYHEPIAGWNRDYTLMYQGVANDLS